MCLFSALSFTVTNFARVLFQFWNNVTNGAQHDIATEQRQKREQHKQSDSSKRKEEKMSHVFSIHLPFVLNNSQKVFSMFEHFIPLFVLNYKSVDSTMWWNVSGLIFFGGHFPSHSITVRIVGSNRRISIFHRSYRKFDLSVVLSPETLATPHIRLLCSLYGMAANVVAQFYFLCKLNSTDYVHKRFNSIAVL